VFDTAFHARMPRRATTYAIDQKVADKHGIRRYGFHGISHEYAAGIAAEFLQRPLNELRLITLHLGNGSSACAVEFGRSTETSMGNTPLEGLVMGTRSGDVDAGVLLALLRSGEFDVDGLDDLLNHRSGLAGLSGLGNDLREIQQAAADGDDQARLAINVFAHRARKYIGAYAAAMGGVDAIVFTGGIGENSASMRRRILQRLEFLGCVLDEDRNQDASVYTDRDHAVITTERTRVEAIVVKTNEELMIARETVRVANDASRPAPRPIPIAISARHCHLTEETFAVLFGADAKPTPLRDLSQPGQFACEERVNLIGPRDRIDGVRLLGPLRSANQVEISRTDEFHLGVDAPVRNSGNVGGSARITVEGPEGIVHLQEGLICARRHIHMQPTDAQAFGVSNGDEVAVAIVGGERDLILGDVLIRVHENYALEMHIDTDEANAAELGTGAVGALRPEDVDEPVYTPVGPKHQALLNPSS
jgi:acetate kinase